jgi:hypothetical protein
MKARMTAQDLWGLGEGELRRELVNGEVIEMAPVGEDGVNRRWLPVWRVTRYPRSARAFARSSSADDAS